MTIANPLFTSLRLGAIEAPNRIIMAPLTRGRCGPDAVPNAMMATYYAQRAGAGLIVTEATGITRRGLGWPGAPGLWNAEQIAGWRQVTDAVHAEGGRIVAQLWHMGRLVHSDLGGAQPVSASATTAPGKAHTYDGKKPYEEARALTVDDIAAVVGDYANAARNAMQAGFDGVQIHAANGYLIDQFLRDSSNMRTDDYGGSVENRARFLAEVTRAVVAAVGADRTGVRLSPNGDTQGVIDSDPAALFGHVASVLDDIGIAFLELREPGPDGTFGSAEQPRQSPLIRQRFKGPLILNSDYTPDAAATAVAEGRADAISFGRPFIANPDLVERIAINAPLNADEMATWYSQGPQGYIDYPTMDEATAPAA